MPVGKVRYYDAEKGFGFLSKDEGGDDVYVRAAALPDGVTSLKRGQKVEFGVVDGKKGEQALSVRLLDPPPSLSKAARKSPEAMAIIVEDLIKMCSTTSATATAADATPMLKVAGKTAAVLRAVADELEL